MPQIITDLVVIHGQYIPGATMRISNFRNFNFTLAVTRKLLLTILNGYQVYKTMYYINIERLTECQIFGTPCMMYKYV